MICPTCGWENPDYAASCEICKVDLRKGVAGEQPGKVIAPQPPRRASSPPRREKETQVLDTATHTQEPRQTTPPPVNLQVEKIALGPDAVAQAGASVPTTPPIFPLPSDAPRPPVTPEQDIASMGRVEEEHSPDFEANEVSGRVAASLPSSSVTDRPTEVMRPLYPPQSPGKVERAVCPQCYAENPPQNLFCQECGSPMPTLAPKATGSVSPRSGAAPSPQAPAPTRGLPRNSELVSAAREETMVMPPVKKALERGSLKVFGFSDVLAIFSVVALGLALSPLFKWRKGMDISIFGYQGVNRPGGPGILPYAGWEWLTLGVVAALALALAFLFLVIRVSRGSMFMLAGWVALFPFIYLVTQSLLPIRTQGMELEKAVGFARLFFGGGGYPHALETTVWLLVGGGVLLMLAGLLAPPRRWLRVVSFVSFGVAVGGLAVFCALAYNWNIFIPEAVRILGSSAFLP